MKKFIALSLAFSLLPQSTFAGKYIFDVGAPTPNEIQAEIQAEIQTETLNTEKPLLESIKNIFLSSEE